MVERDHLGDRAAHRHAHQVGAPHPERVEDTKCVPAQIVACVSRLAWRIAHRTARIAVVVADHESALAGDQLAELLLPPVHRGGRAHDQQDRRVASLAERLGTDLNAPDAEDQFAAQLAHLPARAGFEFRSV